MPKHVDYANRGINVAVHDGDLLGEGPRWDPTKAELVRVDIRRGQVHAWSPETCATSVMEFDGQVSATVRRAGGGMLVAVDHDLIAVAPDGSRTVLASVEQDNPDTRFNDCRCDPQGRLWAGTMSTTRTPDRAALYRLIPGEPIEPVVFPTTLSNGIGWSPQGHRLYFIDSTTHRIDVFDFDGSDGTVHDRRVFAEVAAEDGLPDGMAVDALGGVWVCLFGGGQLRRYDTTGTLDIVLPLPTTNPTCPAFGGPDLHTLFITTAQHKLSTEALANEPLAGAVLALDAAVPGLPANDFAG